ncbi:hypothetical protein VTL71DRAFT_2493 [Oculimacula yallundae]|uniref:Nudix hydrolase domain-containing protein n=1 Tax=Oculimacula yallundae TaxID=86028 RepID=A0ABR4CA78_9HELO
MQEQGTHSKSQNLIRPFQETLNGLIENPYPHVSNPEGCKKRASVALILRVRPNFDHWAETDPAEGQAEAGTTESCTHESLDRFFAQDWVQHGDPEAVFIKRAARVGDRWTSHVALPGGKRDPADEDDKAVAIRETAEEIGLDLSSPHALFIGNLPERVVSTSWGKVPIMVLCPFVFLWTGPDLPPLKLQPTEVASTHWVPLRILLSPSSRTYEYVDVSDRFARQGGVVARSIIRSILGKMRFSAIRLVPSESVFCSSAAEFFPPEESDAETVAKTSVSTRLYKWYLGDHAGSSDKARPLLLWGLTLGMLADFLDQMPPHNAVKLWSYPTFTSLDVRFIINILTAPLKRRNRQRLQHGGVDNQTAMDSETEAVATGDNPWFIGGLSNGMKPPPRGMNQTRSYAVGVMLEGYYDLARRGVWLAASFRLLATLAFAVQLVRRYRAFRSNQTW